MSDADAESACEPSARQRLRRLASLAAWGVVAALSVTAVLILFVWSQTLPRTTRRAIVEWLLRATLAGYAIAVCAAIGGLIVVVRMAWYRRSAKAREPRLARLGLLGFASLFALPIAESAAAIWLAWADRMPRLPIHFEPPDGREHLVVLGGSAALGHPYAPHVSVGQIAMWQLERAMPERNFQLDTLAMLSASLADMHRKLVDLKQRPTVIIIQSGHNEFPSRFDFERNVDLEEAPANRFVDTLYRASLSSALCRCIYGALNENRLDGPPPSMNAHRLIDAPMCTPSEAVSVLDSFQRKLEAIVAYSVQIGAVPVLVIEPSNEASFPPNRSVLPAYATQEDRRWVESQYRLARQAQTGGDTVRAAALYTELVDRQPGFAEGHFQLARVLEDEGNYVAAREHYVQARDLDGAPIRCITALHNAVRRVAARYESAILIDGPAELSAICPHHIVDDHAMQDGVHPSLRGMTALAQAILREMRSRRAFGWSRGEPPNLEVASVATQFRLGSKEWQAVCRWGQGYFQWASGIRFDPSEHLLKARKFEECKKLLSAGKSPDATGFAPLSLQPLSNPTSDDPIRRRSSIGHSHSVSSRPVAASEPATLPALAASS